jgi:hypothetical protein
MRSRLVFLAVSIGVASAQTPINGPLEGFTFDLPTLSLRPVVGSIGSAALGDPLFRGISYGSVAPQQHYALIFENGRCSVALGLGSAETSTVRVPGSFALPDGVAWSGDGSTAVLYSKAGNWIQVLSGLPSAASAGASVSVASLGTLSAVAADTHGAQVAIGVAGGIYRAATGGSFIQLLPIANPVTLDFSDDASTLYGVDAATNQLFALTMATLASQSWPLNLTDPIAIKATRDATSRAVIYVAGRSDRLLLAYDPASYQVIATVGLSFQPQAIQTLGVNTFLFGPRATTADVLWSFRNTPQPTVYFVPAPPVKSRESSRK